MGKIEDPLFHDRVILGKEIVKGLAEDYNAIYNGKVEHSAETLELKTRTFRAYLDGDKKSLPTETFYSIANAIGLKPEDFDFKRMSLTELQKKVIKDWRSKNPERVLDIARRAAPLGIVSQEKKTGKDRKEIMRKVRKSLYEKYGEDTYRIIGQMAQEKFKREHGDGWKRKMIEPAFEALRKKYGDEWGKIVGSNASRKAREKYGQGFQIEYCKAMFGDNWLDVIHGFQWQKENFQCLDENYLAPLFTFVADITGYEGIRIVGLLVQNESLSTKEISEKTKQSITGTRRLMHKLVNSGLVSYKYFRAYEPEKEDFSIDRNQLKQKLKFIKEKNTERIISYINEKKNYVAHCSSENCGFRATYEHAFENLFHCPECDAILNIEEPPKILELLEKKIKC